MATQIQDKQQSDDSDNIIALSSDKTWARMRLEAATAAAQEPSLASFQREDRVLQHGLIKLRADFANMA